MIPISSPNNHPNLPQTQMTIRPPGASSCQSREDCQSCRGSDENWETICQSEFGIIIASRLSSTTTTKAHYIKSQKIMHNFYMQPIQAKAKSAETSHSAQLNLSGTATIDCLSLVLPRSMCTILMFSSWQVPVLISTHVFDIFPPFLTGALKTPGCRCQKSPMLQQRPQRLTRRGQLNHLQRLGSVQHGTLDSQSLLS